MVLLINACSRQASTAGRERPPVPVLAVPATARDVPVEVRAIGNVQAYSLVSIRSQITGPITEVHFQEGQDVKAGDLLFTIDPRPWRAVLNQVQANLNRDQAQMLSARLEFLRTSNLFASKIASQQDYETAEASYQALDATVLADTAAVTNAQVSLDYTAIRSPIDGRTGNLTVKAGNVVKSPDDAILTVAQIRPVYVAFSVPEQNLPGIRRQARQGTLPVEAVVPDEADRPASGELTFINNMVDTNTGTILLKATFANTNDVLWPGQFVRVSLTLSNLVQATVVPTQAIQTGQSGEFVFVVQPDGTVTNKPVATGITYDGLTVIRSGVEAGETVVTDGQLRLTPGARISVKSSESSATAVDAKANSGQK
jgi:multidrug efflux system membrane fusion protein